MPKGKNKNEDVVVNDEPLPEGDQNPKEDEMLTAEEPTKAPKPQKKNKIPTIKQPYFREIEGRMKMLEAAFRFVIGKMSVDAQAEVYAAFPELKGN